MRNFVGTFLFMVSILSVIVVIIDLTSKSDRISKNGSTIVAALTDFYPFWIVWIVNTFLPVAVFISVIYFSSRMAMKTEFVAMLAGGLSVMRLAKPFLIVATGILIISLLINNFILPWANIKKNEYMYEYLLSGRKESDYKSNRRISAQISPNEYIFVQSYNRIKKEGTSFIYQKFDSINNLKEQILARNFDWNEQDSAYVLNDYYHKFLNADEEQDSLANGPQLIKQFSVTPDDILPEEYVAETMNSIELNNFIKKQEFRGSNSVNTYKNEFFQRLSSPFSTIILTIFAFAISTRKRRGGIGLNLALGLFLAFGYLFFDRTAKILSEKQILSPLLASWAPNIVFGLLAAYLFYQRLRSK